jgi:hypothetical protein
VILLNKGHIRYNSQKVAHKINYVQESALIWQSFLDFLNADSKKTRVDDNNIRRARYFFAAFAALSNGIFSV